jgi:hypothetical protein
MVAALPGKSGTPKPLEEKARPGAPLSYVPANGFIHINEWEKSNSRWKWQEGHSFRLRADACARLFARFLESLLMRQFLRAGTGADRAIADHALPGRACRPGVPTGRASWGGADTGEMGKHRGELARIVSLRLRRTPWQVVLAMSMRICLQRHD